MKCFVRDCEEPARWIHSDDGIQPVLKERLIVDSGRDSSTHLLCIKHKGEIKFAHGKIEQIPVTDGRVFVGGEVIATNTFEHEFHFHSIKLVKGGIHYWIDVDPDGHLRVLEVL